jgi:hypothetical protein
MPLGKGEIALDPTWQFAGSDRGGGVSGISNSLGGRFPLCAALLDGVEGRSIVIAVMADKMPNRMRGSSWAATL